MIFVLCFLFSISGVIGGDSCTTRDDRDGECKPLTSCTQAVDDFKRGIAVSFCNKNLICCVSSNFTPTPTKTSNGVRISEKKCEEYSKLTTEVSHITPLSLGGSSNNRQILKNSKCVQSTSLITGGVATKLGEFPHMAAIFCLNSLEQNIKDQYEFLCGGSLISENFVISAAHCYQKPRICQKYPEIVRLGDQNLQSYDDGAREINVPIEKFIFHKYNSQTKQNDIALVKLKRNVEFSSTIRPVCLWQSAEIPKNTATATGFGKIEYSGQNSDVLLKAVLQIRSSNECTGSINSTQICAGGDGTDTCTGDSGGPLQIQHGSNKCIFYIIGITSYGNQYCGSEPSFFTRVSSYIDWIESTVWP